MAEIRATDYFAIVPEWVIHADISANAVRLYAILNRFANGSGKAWPSRRTLAELMRTSTATVDRAKDELVAVGALIVEARTNPAGDPSSNLYTLLTRPHETSSPVRKGMVAGGGTGMGTGDALNRANLRQNQTGNSAPAKKCSACLGKNRDIEGMDGRSCIHSRCLDGRGRISYSYIICPVCDGIGFAP